MYKTQNRQEYAFSLDTYSGIQVTNNILVPLLGLVSPRVPPDLHGRHWYGRQCSCVDENIVCVSAEFRALAANSAVHHILLYGCQVPKWYRVW